MADWTLHQPITTREQRDEAMAAGCGVVDFDGALCIGDGSCPLSSTDPFSLAAVVSHPHRIASLPAVPVGDTAVDPEPLAWVRCNDPEHLAAERRNGEDRVEWLMADDTWTLTAGRSPQDFADSIDVGLVYRHKAPCEHTGRPTTTCGVKVDCLSESRGDERCTPGQCAADGPAEYVLAEAERLTTLERAIAAGWEFHTANEAALNAGADWLTAGSYKRRGYQWSGSQAVVARRVAPPEPPQPEPTYVYMPLTPRQNCRANVREPINNRITVPLIGRDGVTDRMDLSMPQALGLIEGLTRAVAEFCQRADIAAAVRRTEPGPAAAATEGAGDDR